MKILTNFKDRIWVIKYQIYNLFSRQSGLNQCRRRPPLIVSLTSYPPRFDSVFLTIESLLNQNLRPDKIILWLAQEEVAQKPLPLSLTKLKARGLEIRIIKENIKSYKKLIYTLAEFSHCLIVTCDDDFIYPTWFLRDLYRSYQQHPDCISAYRGWVMKWQSNQQDTQQLMPYVQWGNPNQTNKIPSDTLFPTAGAGALYPPNTLNEKVTDRVFMQLCPFADDIWFKAMSLLNHTKVVMVKDKSIDFPNINIKNSQAQTLWQNNIHKNDYQLRQVFDYFKLHDYLTPK